MPKNVFCDTDALYFQHPTGPLVLRKGQTVCFGFQEKENMRLCTVLVTLLWCTSAFAQTDIGSGLMRAVVVHASLIKEAIDMLPELEYTNTKRIQ